MGFTKPTFQEGDNPAAFINGSTLIRQLNFHYIYAINLYLMFVPEWLCFDWSMGKLHVSYTWGLECFDI